MACMNTLALVDGGWHLLETCTLLQRGADWDGAILLHSKTREANSLTVTLELGSSKLPAGASKCTVSWFIALGCCSVAGWTSERRAIWEYCRNGCLPNIGLSPLEEESVESPQADPFMELKTCWSHEFTSENRAATPHQFYFSRPGCLSLSAYLFTSCHWCPALQTVALLLC